MYFSLPRATSSVANTELEKLGVSIDKHVNQRPFPNPRAACDHQGAVAHNILVVVEVAEELLGVFEDIFWLFEEAGAEEVVEDLPELWVALEVADVLLLDRLLYRSEISLQLRVEVFVTLHLKLICWQPKGAQQFIELAEKQNIISHYLAHAGLGLSSRLLPMGRPLLISGLRLQQLLLPLAFPALRLNCRLLPSLQASLLLLFLGQLVLL